MRIKRITAVTVIIMLLSSMPSFAASKAVKVSSAYDAGVYFYEAASDMKNDAAAIVTTTDDFEEIQAEVERGFKAEKIYNGEEPSISQLQQYVFSYHKYTTSQNVEKVKITFDAKYNITYKQYQKYQSKLKSVIKSLNLSGKSDKEKVRKIYRYICKNVEYRSSKKTDKAAYGALVLGYANCQGISSAFYDMCEMAGIECATITGTKTAGSDEITHAWNIVKIGEKWYNCDATWDLGKSKNFKYLFKSDEYFEYTEHFRNSFYRSEEFTQNHYMCSPAGKWLNEMKSAA